MDQPNTTVKPVQAVITSKSKKLLLIVIALFIFLLVLVVVSIFGLSDGKSQNNPTPTPLRSNTDNVATIIPTTIPEISTSLNIDEDIQIPNSNIRQFTSEELGIMFKYQNCYLDGCDGTNIKVKRDGNRVYIYDSNMTYLKYTDGQYIEIFTKDSLASLESAIRSNFLKGYSDSECIITKYETSLPLKYEAKQINFKTVYDSYPNGNLCPEVYTSWGGLAYFEASDLRKDIFVFFSIGNGSNIKGDTDLTAWQNTLQFILK